MAKLYRVTTRYMGPDGRLHYLSSPFYPSISTIVGLLQEEARRGRNLAAAWVEEFQSQTGKKFDAIEFLETHA